MGRRLRFVPPGGALVEVTCRTIHARLLLRPSPELREITLGVLGRAQRRSGVAIQGFVFLSNHYHLLLWVRDAEQLARFVGFLNSNLAREVGRMQAWREKIWGKRYQPILVSEEEGAQTERLLYLLRQGCKEGLVADPLDWPGATSLPAMLDGRPLAGTWFDRTAECQARRRRKEDGARAFAHEEVVVLSPLPAWAHLAASERERRLRELVEVVRAEASERARATGREPMGAPEVLQQDPHAAPLNSRRASAPLVHAASREVRRAFREAYRLFVGAYREAAKALRAGAAWPHFPEGCFPPARCFIRFAPA